jgi:hypothetical protein
LALLRRGKPTYPVSDGIDDYIRELCVIVSLREDILVRAQLYHILKPVYYHVLGQVAYGIDVSQCGRGDILVDVIVVPIEEAEKAKLSERR